MTNYVKTTNFAAKDALVSGNPNKVVKGGEIDAELNNIATASATKTDANNANFTGLTTFANVNITGTSTIATIDGGTY